MINPTYNGGIETADFVPNISEHYDMIEKVARQIVNRVTADNKLGEFEFGKLENGATIEEAIIKLAESHAFAKPSTEEGGSDITDDVKVFAKNYPTLAVRYYKDWSKKQFSVTVSLEQLRKVLLADGNALSISEAVADSLIQGDNYEQYLAIRDLLKYGCAENLYKNVNGSEIINLTTDGGYKKLLLKIKNIVAGMQYVNSDFNTAGIKRKTFADDIRIILPYGIKNSIDVEELAGVFNLDKAEIKNKIIEVDSPENRIVILDKWSTFSYIRLREMTSIFNPKGLYQNYWLTVERLYGISTLFDACYFDVILPETKLLNYAGSKEVAGVVGGNYTEPKIEATNGKGDDLSSELVEVWKNKDGEVVAKTDVVSANKFAVSGTYTQEFSLEEALGSPVIITYTITAA